MKWLMNALLPVFRPACDAWVISRACHLNAADTASLSQQTGIPAEAVTELASLMALRVSAAIDAIVW